MKTIFTKTIRRLSLRLVIVTALTVVLTACGNVIYEEEGDCSVNYRVRFRYDYNMKFADAFAHEVEAVTLYLIAPDGRIAWKKTEEGEKLKSDGYTMSVEVAPGRYDLLALAGTTDKESFSISETAYVRDLTCRLRRKNDEHGAAYIDEDIDRLFHGYLPAQDFSETEGTYTYTVPLVKNTNSVRIVLQHLSGEPVDKELFEFTITDRNGTTAWDNSLLPDEQLTYHAWHTEQGTAGVGEEQTSKASSYFSAAIAELTVSRLTKNAATRLTVRKRNSGETVISIPLIDYALLVKGFYNQEMDDQEYLDRQDEYSLVFFLDEGNRWVDSFIYINSWRVVLNGTDL